MQPNSKTANSTGVGFSDVAGCVEVSKELRANLTVMKQLIGQKWYESAKEYKTILLAVMSESGDANPIACAIPMAKEMSKRGHSPLMLLAVATEMSQASNAPGSLDPVVRRPATMQELAKELDSGEMPQASRRELFISMIAARDLVDYLRAKTGDNSDWPIEIKTDDEDVAAGLVAKLESLERLLPPNAEVRDTST